MMNSKLFVIKCIYIIFHISVHCHCIQVLEFIDNLSFLISNLLHDMRICSLHDTPSVYQS